MMRIRNGRHWDHRPWSENYNEPLLKIPKLTYKVKDSYFENSAYLMADVSSYKKIEGFYHRTIGGDDLDVSFDDPDCKSREMIHLLTDRRLIHI